MCNKIEFVQQKAKKTRISRTRENQIDRTVVCIVKFQVNIKKKFFASLHASSFFLIIRFNALSQKNEETDATNGGGRQKESKKGKKFDFLSFLLECVYKTS